MMWAELSVTVTKLYTEFENGFRDASWNTNKKHNTLY